MKVFDKQLELFNPKDYADLSESDRKNLFYTDKHRSSFVKINGVLYHTKFRKLIYIVNEILGELISQYFKLDTVKSVMYKDEDSSYYWLLSKVFTNEKGHYSHLEQLFPDLIHSSTIGLENLNNIKRVYNYDYTRIYNITKRDFEILSLKLRKLLIRDFITDQTDRHSANYMFCVNKSHVDLMPVYDYEHSLKKAEMKKYLGYFDFDLSNSDVVQFIKNDDMFQELLEIAMRLQMDKIIKRLQEEYPIFLNFFEKYDYVSIIRKKQKEIKKYKLLR